VKSKDDEKVRACLRTADTKNTYIILVGQSEKVHISLEYYQESDDNIKNIPKKVLYWRKKGFDKDHNRD
jgi:hypothetical protein